MPATNTLNADLDQGGTSFQKARVYLGPSLGWKEVLVNPSQTITASGTTNLGSGASLVLVNVSGLVTVVLPDVVTWLRETAWLPATGFARGITIKDLGGHAAAFNITVDGFGTQTIDGSLTSVMSTNFAALRLFPLNDGSGWFIG